MEINERWLSDVGGWDVLKAAKTLVHGGLVEEAERQGNSFTGLVKSGRNKLKASLTATGPKDAICKCSCPSAAGRGLVCAHAIAVVLAVIERERGVSAYQSPGSPRAPVSRGPAKSSSWSAATYQKPSASPAPPVPARPSLTASAAPVKPIVLPEVKGTFVLEIDVERMMLAQPGKRISLMLRLNSSTEPADARIVRWLVSYDAPCATQPMALPPEDLSDLLQKLEGYSHIVPLAKSKVVNNQDALNINVLEGFILSGRLKSTDVVVFEWDKPQTKPFFLGPDLWVNQSGVLRFLAGVERSEIGVVCREMVRDGTAVRPVSWLIRNRGILENTVTLHLHGELEQLRIEPARPIIQVELEGSLREAQVTLSAQVGAHSHRLGLALGEDSGAIYPFQDESEKLLYYVRNLSREKAVEEHFASLGFSKTGTPGILKLSGEDKILSFFASELPRLKKLFQVIEGERWKASTRGVQRIQPQIRMPQVRSGVPGAESAEEERGGGANWLTLEVAYTADNGFQVSRNEVLRLLRGGRNSMRGSDGRMYVLDEAACEELNETLEDAHSDFQSEQKFRIAADAGELLAAYSPEPTALLAANAPMLTPEDVAQRLGELANLLRPYQKEGVRWMERLHRVRRGGLLADEMGLGKTLQSLAMLRLLAHSQAERPAKGDAPTHPALVVCPTSLLYNWAAEVAKFTPEIKCTVLHGDDRKTRLKALDAPGVVITSYGLISRDLDWYLRRPFQTLIMDEASHLRNPDTDAAKALRMVRANSRFALTGTPVENSVRDLWSIFEIIVPKHLGSREEFRDRFQKPISSGSAPADRAHAAMRLRRRTGPYVLRRTKREVAKDLPPRLERVIWCELTDLQKEYYQRILTEGREEIRQARRRSGNQGARATMFTVLLRLRQVCNDLRLLGLDENGQGEDTEVTPVHSGKWAVICDFLEEVRENNGKALIFSQFVSMLRLLKPQVEETGLGMCYLDGQSTDRPEQVVAFQTDAQRQIFLISLKAGGYGLTLTAADQVVLYDPWWNPAVEAQAIDRAHRIGQTQPVTAIRLATRGTVEEKILQLQARKREAAEQTIDDNPVIMPGITDDELEAMLE